jgi:hypothetical protein
MSIFNLFSKRQQELRQEPSDILKYDQITPQLRVQIVHIIKDGFGQSKTGTSYSSKVEELYKHIHDVLCREYGTFTLYLQGTYEDQVCNFILNETNIEKVLDATELGVKMINSLIPTLSDYEYYVETSADGTATIYELNERFKQHAVGFRFEDDRIIKVDSTYVHTIIVKPALQLLFNPGFKGANEEYLSAHEHYRHGRNKECITDCLKAFESTMKIICSNKGWSFPPNATSNGLIGVILTNNLIPSYLQTQITALRGVLESGISTIRNKVGGHGQGAVAVTADDETTRYAMNLTGANIIYLIELSYNPADG